MLKLGRDLVEQIVDQVCALTTRMVSGSLLEEKV